MIVSNPTVSFIILIWNSEKYLVKCFDSIIQKCTDEEITFEVVAIDNGSHDKSAHIIQNYIQKHPTKFRLISLDGNRGTTYPRNLGFKQACGNIFCVLDSDTELGEGSLAEVLKRVSSDKNIGMIAPRLQLPNGSVQNSVKHFPTMLHKLLKIPRICFGIKTRNADFYDGFPFTNEQFVDTAISACWFFRRDLIQEVGILDENIFYSPEDLDYSLRIWKAGFGVLYYPAFTVLHHTQQITHKKPISKTSLSHLKGLLYYYRKHGGWFKAHQINR
jgi:GT2 family glycosyltransferase